MALEELTSKGSKLILHRSVLKGHWRGKESLDELLIYEGLKLSTNTESVCHQ